MEQLTEAKFLHIKGARQHNLKNLELRLPRNRFIAITGVSGSGKSSLAFDTIYAEGYRKFIDSLSTRARQVLEQMPRPDVDFIHGLSPVIAIEQRTGGNTNPRSTVATVTEIADYARLLWSLEGEAYCPVDGGRIVRRTLDDCVDRLMQEDEGSRAILLAFYLEGKPSVLRGELQHLRQKGFQRLRVDGKIVEVDDPEAVPGGTKPLRMELVIDRVILRPDQRSRLADSLELAFREGRDQAIVLVQGKGDDTWKEIPLSQHLSCCVCGTVYPALTPRTFSTNHPDGACETCGGLGQTLRFVEELVIPDPAKTVRSGAVKPWRLGSKRMIIQRNATLKQLAEQLPFDPNTPWQELSEEVRKTILYGAGDRLFTFKLKAGKAVPEAVPFAGVIADLEKTQRETSSEGLKARLMAYQTTSTCPDCNGSRLKASSRAVMFSGLGFDRFMAMDLRSAQDFLQQHEGSNLRDAVDALWQRLHFLNEVGLTYLTLNREFNTLSGGEAQRVRLATQLGMELTGVTYILDEPTIGLHAVDTRKLIQSLVGLRDRGNTVIVVEHDPEVLKAADYLVEIGPGAGAAGGQLVFAGSLAEIETHKASRTGPFLSGRRTLYGGENGVKPGNRWLKVKGASENNLKQVDAAFPVGLLTCVTGVSGSGKSTLVNDVLARAAGFKINRSRQLPGRHKGLEGLEAFTRLVKVDQDPIGRSPRSNPATYTKLFDDLRALYAQTSLAKVRGYKPSRFSFNIRGGRCERCGGDGMIKLDMHFLADVYTECSACQGKRYNRETLEVRYRGLNIADALELTVDEAMGFFNKIPKIQHKLETLQAVGLGYLRLGQAANTLSGGEAQRLKLSLELSKGQQGQTLYILDEPTTGLHWEDIQHLLNLLFQLRDQGNTIIVIEHNLDVIRLADWIVDLGPGGGTAGGRILYSGPVDKLANDCPESVTGSVL